MYHLTTADRTSCFFMETYKINDLFNTFDDQQKEDFSEYINEVKEIREVFDYLKLEVQKNKTSNMNSFRIYKVEVEKIIKKMEEIYNMTLKYTDEGYKK